MRKKKIWDEAYEKKRLVVALSHLYNKMYPEIDEDWRETKKERLMDDLLKLEGGRKDYGKRRQLWSL